MHDVRVVDLKKDLLFVVIRTDTYFAIKTTSGSY